jgi:hypothetical protein
MNKRLTELCKQAMGKDWRYDFDEEVAERFAELIVFECIDLALEWAGGFDGYPRNDVNIVIDEIKKHFGVEE